VLTIGGQAYHSLEFPIVTVIVGTFAKVNCVKIGFKLISSKGHAMALAIGQEFQQYSATPSQPFTTFCLIYPGSSS
jgi:hypothetical protein